MRVVYEKLQNYEGHIEVYDGDNMLLTFAKSSKDEQSADMTYQYDVCVNPTNVFVRMSSTVDGKSYSGGQTLYMQLATEDEPRVYTTGKRNQFHAITTTIDDDE